MNSGKAKTDNSHDALLLHDVSKLFTHMGRKLHFAHFTYCMQYTAQIKNTLEENSTLLISLRQTRERKQTGDLLQL